MVATASPLTTHDPLGVLTGSLPTVEFAGFRRWERDRLVPAHVHDNLHQFDYFSAGEGTYTIDGEAHAVEPPIVFFVPARSDHTMLGSEEHPLVNLTVKFRHPGIGSGYLPPVLALDGDLSRDTAALLRSVIAEATAESPERRVLASLRMAEVLVRIRCAWREGEEGGLDSPHVGAAKRFMRERYAEDLSLDDVAHAAGVAPAHLCRVFKKETGQTPFEFLRRLRVERAKEWLARTTDRVGEVARAVGFGSPREMNRAFQRAEGLSPREYRRRAATGKEGRR